VAVRFKGVNLGGWLLLEGYILGGRNIPESRFRYQFKKVNGDKKLVEFYRLFRNTFIKEDDFRNISLMGANVVRLPFNYRLIEVNPFCYRQQGLEYLQRALRWADKFGLKVILDLHAAPGAQNFDWHGDSTGKALLWEKDVYQQRTYALWEYIVDQVKDSSALLGYDVLNEPVLGKKNPAVLKRFYNRLIKHIRAIDKESIIFLEGDIWAQRIDFLKDLINHNISVSIHFYQPLNYVFNFIPFYSFPGRIEGKSWGRNTIHRCLELYQRFSQQNKVNIFVGEFGINWRGGKWGELEWLEGVLEVFDKFGFDYAYWTYKAVANSVFPDGIYQYIPNNKYICREGTVYGWENYISLWKTEKKKIVDFWRTDHYTPNKKIIYTLSRHFKQ
jgi:aryl-phospho-beta-D-glucosidase BglC (GH1 family)